MMFASGVGKNGNQTLGAAAVGGMLIGTICQLIVVPALFVIFQTIQEKITPIVFEDESDERQIPELEQYAHAIENEAKKNQE
jgi:HAE1 family hydrophobic/amphiphilic exporter-1